MITDKFLLSVGFGQFERELPYFFEVREYVKTFEFWHDDENGDPKLFAIYVSPKGMIGEAIGKKAHYYMPINEPEDVLELLTYGKMYAMKWKCVIPTK